MTHVSVPVREIGLIGLSVSALYAFLAIASYSPLDPSFSFSGQGSEIRNLVGSSGAFIADLLLYLFGLVAYLLPAGMILLGIRLVRARTPSMDWVLITVRTVGWLGMTLSACILIQMHVLSASVLPAGTGGILGAWLSQTGTVVFGWIGLTLISLAGVLIGVQAAIGFSWLDVAEFTGRLLHRGIDTSIAWFDRQMDRLKRVRTNTEHTEKMVTKRKIARIQQAEKPRKIPEIKSAPFVVAPPAEQKRLFDLKTSHELPDLDLLDANQPEDEKGYSEDSLEAISRLLELKLADFGVDAQVVSVLPGPVVTRFEVQPAAGVKVQKISALAKDLARSLAVISVRIVEVIPGKSVVGIEIPNEHREIVRLKDTMQAAAYQESRSPLTMALGKDIAGQTVVADIARMPHLLIAGTTGSGKSVGVNALLMSVLMKSTPEHVRLILVDPKMLELSAYDGIPHLLTPVVTDMRDAAQTLNWCVAEMERRYRLMAALAVRNLAGYNRKVKEAAAKGTPLVDPLWSPENDGEAPELSTIPLILVVIDEFADMMMIVGKKVEQLIARIAQKARAAGIHLVLATQRPSVDVITGLIKANIPTRMSYQVSSKVDSRTILDQGGAEQLLGHGDMLYLPPGTSLPVRVHGAFVSDDEVHRVVSDWKQRGGTAYEESILTGGDDEPFVDLGSNNSDNEDPLYDEAVAFVIESRRPSISSVQRKLRIGYNRAARMIEGMEEAGVVSSMSSNGSREVLVPDRD
ncbi:MAG: DNA translocase FtsK 4TM domain-containing protein [Proteobacteria bacterium]|nr:DNA translocase FtsK 4TM domain-containing protein [Pseudomonadota bacterium]